VVFVLPDVSHEMPAHDQHDREEAIKAIERRRRFWGATAVSGMGMVILAVIWATTEYSNAGGWPTQGFSQSSGIPNEWNYWIIYPILAWVLLTAAGAWFAYRRRQISEEDIKREIEHQHH
jgi:hypothetical protein